MTEARLGHTSSELPRTQGTSSREYPKRPGADEISRLLNVREIELELGLSEYHVYRAVHEGRLHPVQRDGKGRVYYAEWEVREILSQLFGSLGAVA